MEPLTAEEVLQLWEQGAGQRPAERALALLARARPEHPVSALASLTVVELEAELLALRVRTLGRTLEAVDACPRCGTMVELTIDAGRLLPDAGPAPADGAARELRLADEGWQLSFRLPTVGDMLALGGVADPERARDILFERCLHEAATPDGEPVGAGAVEPWLRERVAAAMEQAAAGADHTTRLDCPGCGHAWETGLDVAAFFWRELTTIARRLLREVHQLASRYGWSETDILRLSAARRRAYLEEAAS